MEFKTASIVVGIIVAMAALLTLGDYLGYKIGRKRLAGFVGIVSLVIIVAFAIYSAYLGITK